MVSHRSPKQTTSALHDAASARNIFGQKPNKSYSWMQPSSVLSQPPLRSSSSARPHRLPTSPPVTTSQAHAPAAHTPHLSTPVLPTSVVSAPPAPPALTTNPEIVPYESPASVPLHSSPVLEHAAVDAIHRQSFLPSPAPSDHHDKSPHQSSVRLPTTPRLSSAPSSRAVSTSIPSGNASANETVNAVLPQPPPPAASSPTNHARPAFHPHPATGAQPPSRWAILFERGHCITLIEDFMAKHPELNNADTDRLKLLYQAVQEQDWFFIILLALLACHILNHASIQPLYQSLPPQALSLFALLLGENENLLSNDLLAFVASFPKPLPELRVELTNASFMSAINDIAKCLFQIQLSMDAVLQKCREAEMLPTTHDILDSMGVRSLLFQRSTFRFLLRCTFGSDHGPAVHEAMATFVHEQQEYAKHGGHSDAFRAGLQGKYKSLFHQHVCSSRSSETPSNQPRNLPVTTSSPHFSSAPFNNQPLHSPVTTSSSFPAAPTSNQPTNSPIISSNTVTLTAQQPGTSSVASEFLNNMAPQQHPPSRQAQSPNPAQIHAQMQAQMRTQTQGHAQAQARLNSQTYFHPSGAQFAAQAQAQAQGQRSLSPAHLHSNGASLPTQTVIHPQVLQQRSSLPGYPQQAPLPAHFRHNSASSLQNAQMQAMYRQQVMQQQHRLQGQSSYSVVPSGFPSQARNGFRHTQTPQQVQSPAHNQVPHLFFPSPNASVSQPAQPDFRRSALHQAHIRSPTLKPRQLSTQKSSKDYFRRVVGFVLPPQRLTTDLKQEIHFDLGSQAVGRLLASKPGPDGAPPSGEFDQSSITLRLRCCQVAPGQPLPPENRWTLLDGSWPMQAYFSVNQHALEPRRKLHHGKCLPIDLTHCVRAGDNKLTMRINRSLNDKSPLNFAVAIEVVGFATRDSIKEACLKRLVPAEQILNNIKKSLVVGDDDDIVMQSNMTLRLFEPFSNAKIFDIPVRSVDCLHKDAFDLDVFLDTRPRPYPPNDNVSKVDVWKCPFCNADCRPQNLVVDGFLMDVRRDLAMKKLLKTRSIVVESDGTWTPTQEAPDDEDTEDEATPAPKKNIDVILIDDD